MLLSQYDMHFMPRKATNGQAITDFHAENPRLNSAALFEELRDETAEVHFAQGNPSVWQMYFDGASRTIPREGLVAGVGIVLISPPKPCHPARILSHRTMHQQCCRVQCPVHWLAIGAPVWSKEPPSLR